VSDTNTNSGDQPAQTPPAMPQMRILGQFVRDLSFENIVAQTGGGAEMKPNIKVSVSLDAKKRSIENQYEVVSKYTVTSVAQDSDATLFVIELEYGAIFHVENVPDAQLHPYLLIECPRMVFPYVRRIVSDLTHDGGFPGLNLEPIDFVSLYRQSLVKKAEAAAAEKAQAPTVN